MCWEQGLQSSIVPEAKDCLRVLSDNGILQQSMFFQTLFPSREWRKSHHSLLTATIYNTHSLSTNEGRSMTNTCSHHILGHKLKIERYHVCIHFGIRSTPALVGFVWIIVGTDSITFPMPFLMAWPALRIGFSNSNLLFSFLLTLPLSSFEKATILLAISLVVLSILVKCIHIQTLFLSLADRFHCQHDLILGQGCGFIFCTFITRAIFTPIGTVLFRNWRKWIGSIILRLAITTTTTNHIGILLMLGSILTPKWMMATFGRTIVKSARKETFHGIGNVLGILWAVSCTTNSRLFFRWKPWFSQKEPGKEFLTDVHVFILFLKLTAHLLQASDIPRHALSCNLPTLDESLCSFIQSVFFHSTVLIIKYHEQLPDSITCLQATSRKMPGHFQSVTSQVKLKGKACPFFANQLGITLHWPSVITIPTASPIKARDLHILRVIHLTPSITLSLAPRPGGAGTAGRGGGSRATWWRRGRRWIGRRTLSPLSSILLSTSVAWPRRPRTWRWTTTMVLTLPGLTPPIWSISMPSRFTAISSSIMIGIPFLRFMFVSLLLLDLFLFLPFFLLFFPISFPRPRVLKGILSGFLPIIRSIGCFPSILSITPIIPLWQWSFLRSTSMWSHTTGSHGVKLK